MADPHAEIEAAIDEATKARNVLAKKSSLQVSASAELGLLKATAQAWLRNHRSAIAQCVDAADVDPIDDLYRKILENTERRVLRSRYRADLLASKKALVALRSKIATIDPVASTGIVVDERPPNFTPLVADLQMQAILIRRWDETLACINGGAHLAATVMMGGFLETLFLARLNLLSDKSPAFTAQSAPKDKKGKTLELKEWTLRHYIDVGHELSWITESAKNVSVVLRDYRNYIHPHKELSHGIVIGKHDSVMFWNVCKSLTTQIIASI